MSHRACALGNVCSTPKNMPVAMISTGWLEPNCRQRSGSNGLRSAESPGGHTSSGGGGHTSSGRALSGWHTLCSGRRYLAPLGWRAHPRPGYDAPPDPLRRSIWTIRTVRPWRRQRDTENKALANSLIRCLNPTVPEKYRRDERYDKINQYSDRKLD